MTETQHNRIDRARGAMLGLAVGDAIGTTVEFKPRGTFTPLTDMVGGGPFKLQPGQWTDDTSMALCLGHSLVAKGFDLNNQMQRYLNWHDNGYMSSTGRCFDIGSTTHTTPWNTTGAADNPNPARQIPTALAMDPSCVWHRFQSITWTTRHWPST
jgi:ADP-ribosylglycohydrolase